MSKYLMMWEVDKSRLPVDPKERVTGFHTLVNMVKKDIEDGIITDWGAFVGEHNGYAIFEGNEVEVGKRTEQYVPFVIFKTYPVATIEQVDEVHKAYL